MSQRPSIILRTATCILKPWRTLSQAHSINLYAASGILEVCHTFPQQFCELPLVSSEFFTPSLNILAHCHWHLQSLSHLPSILFRTATGILKACHTFPQQPCALPLASTNHDAPCHKLPQSTCTLPLVSSNFVTPSLYILAHCHWYPQSLSHPPSIILRTVTGILKPWRTLSQAPSINLYTATGILNPCHTLP